MGKACRESGLTITEVVSGKQKSTDRDGRGNITAEYGADYIGELYAKHIGVPVRDFPADWIAHGNAAGPMRNRQMAKYADALIAFWDGKSKGTANMINEMKRLGKPVIIQRF